MAIFMYLLGATLAIPAIMWLFKDEREITLGGCFLAIFLIACAWITAGIVGMIAIIEYWNKPIWRRKK